MPKADLIVVLCLLAWAAPAEAQPRVPRATEPPTVADGVCAGRESRFRYELGPPRSYPDSLFFRRRSDPQVDYYTCYNDRGRLEQELRLDEFRRANAGDCGDYVKRRQANRPTSAALRAKYNQECTALTGAF